MVEGILRSFLADCHHLNRHRLPFDDFGFRKADESRTKTNYQIEHRVLSLLEVMYNLYLSHHVFTRLSEVNIRAFPFYIYFNQKS